MQILTSEKRLPYLFLLPSLLFLAGISIFPLAYNFYVSVHEFILYKPTQISFVGGHNYIEALKDPAFLTSLKITFLFLGVGLLLQIPIGTGMALLLNKELRGSRVIKTLMLFPMIVTPIVVGLIFKMMYHPTLGVINYFFNLMKMPRPVWLGSSSTALLTLILTDTWQWTPFAALIILTGLQSLPKEPLEAAVIDGASRGQVIMYIVFPLLTRIFVITFILRTIWIFRTFDTIYIMTSGGPGSSTTTLGFYIFQVGYEWLNYGYATALSMILVNIIAIVCTLYLRFSEKMR